MCIPLTHSFQLACELGIVVFVALADQPVHIEDLCPCQQALSGQCPIAVDAPWGEAPSFTWLNPVTAQQQNNEGLNGVLES